MLIPHLPEIIGEDPARIVLWRSRRPARLWRPIGKAEAL
jgi:hypothetical protein